MTLYTTIMFLLAGLGSALGTSTYAAFGWNGIVLASSGLSLLVVVATHLAYRLQPGRRPALGAGFGSSQRPGLRGTPALRWSAEPGRSGGLPP